ncbi:RNA polymerase sigma factor [Parageobacillus toebii]|uniref:RNA polymerase sigma factor n=1 Tax=Parageobacillus toebii TaxID=153151 RepID=UPI002E2449D1|nr:sigma-70 family RNA polymerase sigma factor [Parageobacillus toebii]
MEKEIVQRIQQGDEKAFAELYHLYAEYALRVATVVTKSRANAADAVQETFIRVYDHIDRFDPAKAYKPWFYRILLNECNRLMKKQAKMVAMSDYIDDHARMANVDQHAHGESGRQWNDEVAKYYLVDNGQGGTFVIEQHYFVEASEGHGARFDNMLKQFQVTKEPDKQQ